MSKPLTILTLCAFLHLPSLAWTESTEPKNPMMTEVSNVLGAEKSPYLLQHKNNPVNWQIWGDEAFELAKAQNKPVFLSIGYSTCYWCHVMEKDSFEQQEVADVLNENFIAIKVDREERPDVDKVYMDAVVAMTGHGGWPMSVFLTPDRKPFFGGTFFPKERFIHLLGSINDAWNSKRSEINESSEQLLNAIKNRQLQSANSEGEYSEQTFKDSLQAFHKVFDEHYGGFGQAPKFPRSENVSLLLRLSSRLDDSNAQHMATHTLKSMAYGGIYDHLGGGFARYSTDEKWLVPHFEKMLYDNALMAFVNLEAYQLTKNELFSSVARETLDYVLNEMTDPKGGFYSAQDAGEVGKEGEFYVWIWPDLKAALTEDELKKLAEVYAISEGGNFEHGSNILNLRSDQSWEAKNDKLLKSASAKLLKLREEREAPHKDDKILTAWNGLMISAMARASRALGEQRYLEAAAKSAQFIKDNLFKDGKLLRRYRDGDARFSAYLDDHAYLIAGLIELYQASYDLKWLQWAKELQSIQDKLFLDPESSAYFYSSKTDGSLIVRSKELEDGAIPSANAVTMQNLLLLSDYYFDRGMLKKAEKLMATYKPLIDRYPPGFSSAISAISTYKSSSKEIAVVGDLDSKEAKQFKDFLSSSFLPNVITGFGAPADFDNEKMPALFRGKQVLNGKTTFYVCENHTCKIPTNDPDEAKRLVLDQS